MDTVQPRGVVEVVEKANRTALAKEVGVSRGFVSQVLSGKNVPSLGVAARMAKGLGVSLDEFHRYWEGVQNQGIN